MISLEIRRPGKEPRIFTIAPGIYTLGHDDECAIRLPVNGIEGRHAMLVVRDEGCWIEDLTSSGGTLINGESISGRSPFASGMMVALGDAELLIHEGEPAPQEPESPAKTEEEPLAPPPEETAPPPTPTPPVPESTSSQDRARIEQARSIKQQIHHELMERLDIKRLTASHIDAKELRERAMQTIQSIVREVTTRLPSGMDPDDLIRDIVNEALGLGPLEDFLEDESITEIMVNGPSHVYVERGGRLQLSEKTFMDDASVLAVIERIVSPIGRRIDESQPYVDARLPDGSRVNAIIHPLSLIGPCLTIRKFSKRPFTVDDLIRFGTLTPAIAELARVCVVLRKNIVVSGGTGSGKTSLLNVLSSYLPETDRILTIEDAAELRLPQQHVIRLEARPPNIEGRGAITIRDLVRNALRMRPDRIVVGECRGGEALDMLQAMNTGHDGSLTTVHANSPRDVISRLETMVLMSGMELPVRAIREQIAAAVDIIVHESRFSDGSRKVTKVTEIVGQEGDQITMQDIFEYVQTGVDENDHVVGHYRPTGAVPTFIEEIGARGLNIDRTIFDPQHAQESSLT